MRVNAIISVAALAATASAKTVRVDVGKDGLSFTPDVIEADKGDTLDFHFYPQKHSVVLGDKDKACSPAASGAFFSGFMPTSNGEAKSSFQVEVNSTDALYIYCSAAKHCQGGMVAVVNGDKDGLDKYKDAAAKASENVSPDEVAGGKVVSASGGDSTATTTGAGATSSGTGAGATSSPSSTAKPGAAAGFKASVAGVLAAAGGVAAMML